MTDTCTTLIGREEILVGYLYDDIDPAARAAFEEHMQTCSVCRDEVVSLRGVRRDLAQWAPPERRTANAELRTASDVQRTENLERRTWWRQPPAWAQVAAALLFLGVAAGLANLNVRYDSTGLTVRTGWMAPAAGPSPVRVDPASAHVDGVTRADLTALEASLRGELRALQTSAHTASADGAQPARTPGADADLLRRVRGLVDDSEKRQQTELALRIGEVLRDVNMQRQADLVKIDRNLGLVQNNLGVEVLKQRERVNYLMRVNQSVPVR